MRDEDILTGIVLEEACLTVEELASVCAVSPEWVIRHLEEELLCAFETNTDDRRFSSLALRRAQRMLAVERDFDAAPELAALFADLLEELDTMRARLRRAGLA